MARAFLEGSAPALPLKISVVREHDPSVKNPKRRMNSALRKKFVYQPLAKASGMGSLEHPLLWGA